MSKLKRLAETIVKDGKMTSDNVIRFLIDTIEDGDSDGSEFEDLYKAAYGEKINKSLAESWVNSMAVTDGSGETSGEKWNCEETTEVGNNAKIQIDWSKISKVDFYIAMNMVYSDFYSVAKAIGMQEDPVFYGRLAKAFLDDDDAIDNKLYHYYFCIVSK